VLSHELGPARLYTAVRHSTVCMHGTPSDQKHRYHATAIATTRLSRRQIDGTTHGACLPARLSADGLFRTSAPIFFSSLPPALIPDSPCSSAWVGRGAGVINGSRRVADHNHTHTHTHTHCRRQTELLRSLCSANITRQKYRCDVNNCPHRYTDSNNNRD